LIETGVVIERFRCNLIRAFTGCSPVYSPDEIDSMSKSTTGIQGQILKFLGRDVRSQLEKERQAFETVLLQTMTEVAKVRAARSNARSQSNEGIGFLQALSLSAGVFDLAEGVPRVVVISPMILPITHSFGDAKSAREQGFALATKLGADFQRAEVYLTGISHDASKHAREFAHALFLGMKGRLVSVSGEALPPMAEPPSSVKIFGGFIDYVGVKVPMQMRLAIDRSGSLVNSWAEVSVLRPIATPMTGKAICNNEIDEKCEVKGDGKEFAQSWVVDVRQNPTFDEKLPFSGVRYFEFVTTATGLNGKVYDPNVSINGKKEMVFELANTPKTRF
jgi:hypothetical protein